MSHGTPDIMTCAISRLLRDRETVFFGLGSPLVMVSTLLAKATHAPNLTLLSLPGSVDPRLDELPRYTADSAMLKGARSTFALSDIFDLSARGRLDTAFLSGVQIDHRGQINMSAIGPAEQPKVRLPGGAGAALLCPTARRVILWRTKHDRRIFVPELDFVTACGNVEWVVTPLCVFRRGPDGFLDVHSIHPGISPDQVTEATGFSVTVGPDTPTTPAPSVDELETISRIDPQAIRATEF